MWAAQHCSRLFSTALNRLCVFCCVGGFKEVLFDVLFSIVKAAKYPMDFFCCCKLCTLTEKEEYGKIMTVILVLKPIAWDVADIDSHPRQLEPTMN